jgi:hypothetical protein
MREFSSSSGWWREYTPYARTSALKTLGFVGVLQGAALLLALLMAKKNADTIRAWKVIAAANIYLILLWPFLMLSH